MFPDVYLVICGLKTLGKEKPSKYQGFYLGGRPDSNRRPPEPQSGDKRVCVWYDLNDEEIIVTPDWDFWKTDLKRFKNRNYP